MKELLRKRTDALSKRKALHDAATAAQRNLTPEEQTEFDTLGTLAADLKAQIDRAETVEAEQHELNAAQPRRTLASVSVHENWTDDPKKGFKSFGSFCADLVADGSREETSAEFRRWRNYAAGTPGMVAGVTSDGGALVPSQFVADILEKPIVEDAVISRLQTLPITMGANVEIPYVVESSRVDGSRQGGVRVYRNAELAAATASKPSVGMLKLHAEKLVGMAYVSEEMLRFSPISIEPLLTRMFGKEFVFKIVNEVINGDGSAGTFTGILAAPATVEVAKETLQTADTINSANVTKMWARRHIASGPYVWLVNQDCMPQLQTMSVTIGTAGELIYMPPGGLSGTPYGTLMGAPVIEVEQCQTVGDKGDIVLAGLSQYIYAPVPGIDAQSSIHLKFDNGQTAFRWTMFNAGAPWWASALTPFKGSNTVSPFVTLAARA